MSAVMVLFPLILTLSKTPYGSGNNGILRWSEINPAEWGKGLWNHDHDV